MKIREGSLYLVMTESLGLGRGALEMAASAIAGGADIIQMREKNRPREDLLTLGRALRSLCRKRKTVFIVNDDPVLAKETLADGVHLGQDDIEKYPVKEARRILGGGAIIGISTHSLGQFEAANALDADYIAFGPVFPTKARDYCVGTEDVGRVLAASKKQVFFIGGVNSFNIIQLLERGARNVAVTRAVLEADDIEAAAKNIKEMLAKAMSSAESGDGKEEEAA